MKNKRINVLNYTIEGIISEGGGDEVKEITNDIELTKQRQEDMKLNGKPCGFPVHLLMWEGNYKVFFTKIGMERYIEQNKIRKYEYRLLLADDVKKVEYEV